MRLRYSKVMSAVLAASALCVAAPSAYAGGRAGLLWWPNPVHGTGHGGPWDHHGGPNGQGDGRWDNSHIGWNDGRDGWNRRWRNGCGFGGWGGAGWGGCQNVLWNEGAYDYALGNVLPAPVYPDNYEGGVIYSAAVASAAPPANPKDACWVLKLTYDKSGAFAGAHRINGCLTGPRVINLSAPG